MRQSVDRVRAAVVNAGGELPAAADHHRAVAGVDAEAGERLRPRPGRRRCWPPPARCRGESVDRLVLLGELGPRRLGARHPRGAAGGAGRGPGRASRRWSCPAANADEAALVESVEVLAARTLAEVVDHLAGRTRLTRHVRGPLPGAAAGARPRGRRRAGVGTAGGRGRRRRRAPPVPDRPAGRRQDDAGRAAARAAAAARRAGGARGDRDPLGRRHAAAGRAAGHPADLRGAAPLGHDGRAGRRRVGADPAGRAVPGPPRRAVPRRGARVPAGRARHAAPAAGARAA